MSRLALLPTPRSPLALMRWLSAALLLLGCADDAATPRMAEDRPGADVTVEPADTTCRTPNTDCPCDEEGEVVACGVPQDKTNTYVICQHGSRTCTDGAWGTCELDGKTKTLSLST